jgi:hypothetical protein
MRLHLLSSVLYLFCFVILFTAESSRFLITNQDDRPIPSTLQEYDQEIMKYQFLITEVSQGRRKLSSHDLAYAWGRLGDLYLQRDER